MIKILQILSVNLPFVFDTSGVLLACTGGQITDSEAQKQQTGKTAAETVQSLNRDVANANQKLEKQDLTKAQKRQEMAQTIGQISEDWLQFAVGDKLKEADKKRQEAGAIEKENPAKATALRAQAQAIEAI